MSTRARAEPLEALLDRPQHAVATEVPDAPVGRRHVEAFVVALRRGAQRLESPSDLRRQDVLAAGTVGEGRPEATFGEPEPVVRCGVEVADPLFPGGVDRRAGLFVRDRPVEVAELRAAQRKLGQAERAARDGPGREGRSAFHRSAARLKRQGSSGVDQPQPLGGGAASVVCGDDVRRHVLLPSLVERVLREGGARSLEVFTLDCVEELETVAEDQPAPDAELAMNDAEAPATTPRGPSRTPPPSPASAGYAAR